jgi:hypothetical protein
LALDLLYLVSRKGLLMTAVGASKRLSGHQLVIFSDNLSLAGPATEPNANAAFAIGKTDIW